MRTLLRCRPVSSWQRLRAYRQEGMPCCSWAVIYMATLNMETGELQDGNWYMRRKRSRRFTGLWRVP
jgi:hypothetical protein